MAPSRKRKHASTDEASASKQTPAIATPKTIKAFAAVSKATVVRDDGVKSKKRKTVSFDVTMNQNDTRDDAAPRPIAKSEKKRKRDREEAVPEESDSDDASAPRRNTKDGIFAQFAKKPASTAPRTKRSKPALPPSPKETPSKRAAALFSNLDLGSAARPIPFSLSKQQAGIGTPPLTPSAEEAPLPAELDDLAHLHSAFLSALSLHYAHNGTASPVPLPTLLEQITKTWKKRAVTLEDLRRTLALSPDQRGGFVLQDYGRGGVCLARSTQQPRGRAVKRAASYVEEEELNASFSAALERSWRQWQEARTNPEDAGEDAAAFTAQLPLAPLTLHPSAEKAGSLFARGAQRLADIKGASQQHQTADVSAALPATPSQPQAPTTPAAVASRGSSLLDRILAKQALTSTSPSGPTKADLELRAALHRSEDIARVLNLLAGTKARATFSLPVVVQHLQQSLRSPISKEEAERCLDVLAEEVAPGFVRVVVSGSVKGVVITKAASVGAGVLRERVERAIGGLGG